MNVSMIQEGGIGAYAAIALGLLGCVLGGVAIVALLGKSRSAFSLGVAALVVSTATAGAGMLGTVYGRMQVSRAVAYVDSSVDLERIMRVGFREAQSSSWIGLFAALLPLVLGAAAALGGSRLQPPPRGPAQGFGGPVVSSDDGLGGQSMVAIVFAVIALLGCGGAWVMAHSELPKLRYAIDENDSDSWELANALERLKDTQQANPCDKLNDALEPFWGATDRTEWPRTMRRPISSELAWRPAADDCVKKILESLDRDDRREGRGLTGARWTQEGLLQSALLQDEALHARALAWAAKAPDEAEGLGSKGGTGVVGGGTLSRAEIAQTVKSDLQALRSCYERELLKAPSLGGKLVVQFTIGSSGQVVSAEESSAPAFPSAKVTGCVLGRVRALKFPAPLGGGVVTVNYPFSFQAAN